MLEISAENVITKLGKFVLVFLFFFFFKNRPSDVNYKKNKQEH